mmetsp:Transcript_3653/g.7566  ORF Transcript_3653/g.7566 Transcript_3653/m.7566 type:complete len:144 (+) Transcript_3653:761-1192(+)
MIKDLKTERSALLSQVRRLEVRQQGQPAKATGKSESIEQYAQKLELKQRAEEERYNMKARMAEEKKNEGWLPDVKDRINRDRKLLSVGAVVSVVSQTTASMSQSTITSGFPQESIGENSIEWGEWGAKGGRAFKEAHRNQVIG